MPHLVIVYTPNIKTDFDVLCRTLCDTLLALRDEEDKPAYPPGGTRVMAFPAAHYAVADGKGDYAFMYLNLRIWGRSREMIKKTGDALLAAVGRLMDPIIAREAIGITLQIDETPKVMPGNLVQGYEDRYNTLHALFKK
jgi:5-carboxymethyl-2-hydroxymuconate isomerase